MASVCHIPEGGKQPNQIRAAKHQGRDLRRGESHKPWIVDICRVALCPPQDVLFLAFRDTPSAFRGVLY